jgi:peptidoglycan hydrolase-like protein with peptidoglycan-binding domain
MKKRTVAALFVLLLIGTSGLAYGVGRAGAQLSAGDAPRAALARETATTHPGTDPVTSPMADPATRTSLTPHPTGAPTHRARPRPKPRPAAGPRLIGPGDDGSNVRDLQARLKQIAWYSPDISGSYGGVTSAAVKGFQAKRGIAVTGVVDRRTLDRLHAMTRTPTSDELKNIVTTSVSSTRSRLDSRCTTGRALCIDKTSQTVRWVVAGRTKATYAVRFGASYSPTREGLFHVQSKSADHVSRLYGSAMPYSMFFSGGQAVHYSSDFAARGYAGASHGCVNVRDYDGIKWLFGQVEVGDKVVVYWS